MRVRLPRGRLHCHSATAKQCCSSSSVAACQAYKYTNETTNLCMLTGVGVEFRPRKLVFESFESKAREGMGRQQEQAEGLRKKSKVFHTLCTCGT
jgi:hypothetical protein